MGTPLKKHQQEYHDNEQQLTVTVKDLRIAKYPITAGEMCAFLNSPMAAKSDSARLYGTQGYTIIRNDVGRFEPRDDNAGAPADEVAWDGAFLFCKWASEQTGVKYRLPSEAEWELVAAGKERRPWPWGDDDPTPQHGWRYWTRSDQKRKPVPPVGSHPANATPDGVHDMLAYRCGEWCVNKYFDQPTAEQVTATEVPFSVFKLPLNILSPPSHVLRGYEQRSVPRKGFWILQATEYGRTWHFGRPWTRVGYIGWGAVRVVEE